MFAQHSNVIQSDIGFGCESRDIGFFLLWRRRQLRAASAATGGVCSFGSYGIGFWSVEGRCIGFGKHLSSTSISSYHARWSQLGMSRLGPNLFEPTRSRTVRAATSAPWCVCGHCVAAQARLCGWQATQHYSRADEPPWQIPPTTQAGLDGVFYCCSGWNHSSSAE